MTIRFGPAGLGPTKTAITTLEDYHKKGFRACEIAFTYSVYIKEPDAIIIGKKAKELDIRLLQIHAQYFVNLNSEDPKKREATKKRILDCCKIGNDLGAKVVVFHPGYYLEDKEASFQRIKAGVLEIMNEIKKNKWNIRIAPETMGKVNVFGSLEEISRLVNETGCSFCIDFAHILARDKKVDYNRVIKLFPQKEWHVHFSGIEYGEKGEKNHLPTPVAGWKELLAHIPKDKEVRIVNESPQMIEDAESGLALSRRR